MTSVDSPIAQMSVRHQLTRPQLVEALATMTACTQHHSVRHLDDWPPADLVAALGQHLEQYGTKGRPTYPRAEHRGWAEEAADKLLPLLAGATVELVSGPVARSAAS